MSKSYSEWVLPNLACPSTPPANAELHMPVDSSQLSPNFPRPTIPIWACGGLGQNLGISVATPEFGWFLVGNEGMRALYPLRDYIGPSFPHSLL